MKKIYYIATIALVVGSCANDEVVDSSGSDPNAISYSVTTNNAISRASCLHSAGDYVPFVVSAIKHSESPTAIDLYFKDDVITVVESTNADGTKSYTFNSDFGVRYWPNDNSTLDFFAVHNKDNISSGSSSGGVLVLPTDVDDTVNGKPSFQIGYTTSAKTNSQSDLLYAVATDKSKGTDGKVTLNFRHALAQITVNIKNKAASGLKVEVKSVSIVNLVKSADAYFTTSTADNYLSTSDDDYFYSDNCFWNIPTADEARTGNVSFTKDITLAQGESFTPELSQQFLVIPQQILSNNGTLKLPVDDEDYTAFGYLYFKLSCRVTTVPDGTFSTDAVPIFGGDDGALADLYIAIPKVVYGNDDDDDGNGSEEGTDNAEGEGDWEEQPDIDEPDEDAENEDLVFGGWKAGMHYTYNIIFGGGGDAATYDGDGNSVFNFINLNVTTDEWAEGGTTSLDE